MYDNNEACAFGEKNTRELSYISNALETIGDAIAGGIDETGEKIAEAIKATLISPNEADRNLEAANVVDGLFAIARGLHHVADALERFNPKEK
jgi:hypothetical protein